MRMLSMISFCVVALGFVSDVGVLGQETKKGNGVKEELKRLEGTWRVVAVELGGKETNREEIGPNNLLVFSGTKSSVVTGTKKRIIECTFTVDPTKSPKWMDTTRISDKVSWPGIYELKGDTLKVFLG
jgi:uncharacterized protein (TIGR03067 family)